MKLLADIFLPLSPCFKAMIKKESGTFFVKPANWFIQFNEGKPVAIFKPSKK